MDFASVEGINWDSGNAEKSADKHGVAPREAEQVFFNEPLVVVDDPRHSVREARFHALGRTDSDRLLHVTFTVRDAGRLIRVISARPMHRKERERFMAKLLKRISKFRSEAAERRFWQTHDSTEYVDWSKAARVRLPNLKPSTKSISLRLSADLLDRIKIEANRRDVPYQSLIKVWLEEKG